MLKDGDDDASHRSSTTPPPASGIPVEAPAEVPRAIPVVISSRSATPNVPGPIVPDAQPAPHYEGPWAIEVLRAFGPLEDAEAETLQSHILIKTIGE